MTGTMLAGRGRWAVAAIGATVITVTLAMLFRLPPPPLPLARPAASPAAPRASVKLARPDAADRLLKEEADLRDLRPLFLPTERNASLAEPRLEPGRTLLDNDYLKPGVAETEMQVGRELPPVVTLNGKKFDEATPLDALADEAAHPTLLGFGRHAVTVPPFPARGGYIEVMSAKDGARVFAQDLPTEARPPGDKPWSPAEFLAVVDAGGLASPLVVTEGSRVEEVDIYLRNFLARDFRIGDRLAPGFYRITVAP